MNDKDQDKYNAEDEWDQGAVFEIIRDLPPQQKAALWNKRFPHIKIDSTGTDEEINNTFELLTDVYFNDFIPLVAQDLDIQ